MDSLEFRKHYGVERPRNKNELFELVYYLTPTGGIVDKAEMRGHLCDEFISRYIKNVVPRIYRDANLKPLFDKEGISEKMILAWIFPKLNVRLWPLMDYHPPAPYISEKPSPASFGNKSAPKVEYDLKALKKELASNLASLHVSEEEIKRATGTTSSGTGTASGLETSPSPPNTPGTSQMVPEATTAPSLPQNIK